MELIFDTQFKIIYVLKAISLAFAIFALYLTERLFSELYMKTVYAMEQYPPSLQNFLLLFLFIHAGFNLFIFIVLLLLLVAFKRPNNNFIVNWFLIQTYFIDYFVITVMMTALSAMIASIMQKNKYFRYKTEGLRAVRGLREIMQYIAYIVFFIPYFYFLL